MYHIYVKHPLLTKGCRYRIIFSKRMKVYNCNTAFISYFHRLHQPNLLEVSHTVVYIKNSAVNLIVHFILFGAGNMEVFFISNCSAFYFDKNVSVTTESDIVNDVFGNSIIMFDFRQGSANFCEPRGKCFFQSYSKPNDVFYNDY